MSDDDDLKAKNTGVFDTAEHGWLWDLDVNEVCITGTYKIERKI